jgi:purine-binding chemotaxis protein CheW
LDDVMSPAKLDWEAIWKSLNWDDSTRQQEAEQVRLRHRTQLYAAPLAEHKTPAEDTQSFLTFELGTEHYGIDVLLVRGVRSAPRITPIPGTPNFYRGVINVRGQIITVLDLRLFFGLTGPETVSLPGEIVLAQVESLQLALLAQQIHGVIALTPPEINPVEHLPYAMGITRDRMVILNLRQLFEDKRLLVGVDI